VLPDGVEPVALSDRHQATCGSPALAGVGSAPLAASPELTVCPNCAAAAAVPRCRLRRRISSAPATAGHTAQEARCQHFWRS